MANFLQKIGFLKPDEEVEVTSPTAKPAATIVAPLQPLGKLPVGNASRNYDDYLSEVLEKNNQPGFDFFEFNKTLLDMDGKAIGEQAKYELAYSAAKSMGVKPADLEQSANYYLSKLAEEEQSFNQEEAAVIASDIDAKNQKIADLAKRNQQLAAEIEANNQQSQTLTKEVFDSTNAINVEKQAFQYSLTNVRSIIADRVAKINQYLKANASI